MEERLYPALITEALRNVRYPGNGKDLVENNMVEDDIRIDGMNVSFSLILTNRQIRLSRVWSRPLKQQSRLMPARMPA